MKFYTGLLEMVDALRKRLLPALLLGLVFSFWSWLPSLSAQGPVVRAVLFYSPSCPHCHQVIEEFLMPLFEQYGEKLEMVGVDTSSQGGAALFGSAIQRYDIPPEQQVVPMLIIGETILLGSYDIPDQFPGLIEHYLAQGGLDWPDIPGLRDALASAPPESTASSEPTRTSSDATSGEKLETPIPQAVSAQPSPTAQASGLILPGDTNPGLGERLARDPAGNTLAIIVLLGMLFTTTGIVKLFRSGKKRLWNARPSLWIPVLCLAGGVVAGYLAYVETAQVQAVCGPVGDCNTVQQSQYARLFGVLPIGILGLFGYLAILATWLVGRYGAERPARLASQVMLGMTLCGVLFSIYLTFLEPFVIGATCAWCLSSALLMTALMWLAAIPARAPSGALVAGSLPTPEKAA